MMNKLILYLLCLLSTGCSNSIRKEHPRDMDPFSPILKQKIQDFIHYVDSVYPEHTDEMFYTFNARVNNDTNIIIMNTEYYYNPEWYNIGGYTFLDSNLIVFQNAPGPRLLKALYPLKYKFYTPHHLIDTTKLIKFQDSIPGYHDGRKGVGEYEPYMFKYRLMGQDSLVLIFSGTW